MLIHSRRPQGWSCLQSSPNASIKNLCDVLAVTVLL